MLLEVATLPQASKEFKAFCNALRCPLCQSQLDGNIHPKKANLYCARDNNEYRGIWLPDIPHPEQEYITYWYPQYEYEISIVHMVGNYATVIDRYNRDMTAIHRHTSRKRVFEYQGARLTFFRQRMEEEQFLKKLKTYNVFS